MIEIRKLKQLIQLMKNNDLTELDIRDGEEHVTLKRGYGEPVHVAPAAPPPQAAPPPAPAQGPSDSAASGSGGGEATPADSGLVEIPSPMVGTFYASPSPDAEPFVRVGSRVEAETVVCVIEAMKVFNEIKAETTGTIEKVLIGNGQAVEYGEPLFLVKPD